MIFYAFLIQRAVDKEPFAVIWTNRALAEACKDRVSEVAEVVFEEIPEPRVTISHSLTCPVSRPGFVVDLTRTQCTCDFMERLKEAVTQ